MIKQLQKGSAYVLFVFQTHLINFWMFEWMDFLTNCLLVMIFVATFALGSWPRQAGCKVMDQGRPESHITCSRECKECEGMNLHTPKWTPIVGVRVLNELPNLQSTIRRVKTHQFEESFISLKIIET